MVLTLFAGSALAAECFVVVYMTQGAPFASMAGMGGMTYLELDPVSGNIQAGTYQNYPVGTMIQQYYFKSFRLSGTSWVSVVERNYQMPSSTALQHIPSEKLIQDQTGQFAATLAGMYTSCPAANPC